MEILEWLQQWYASQTDGDWEHTYGIQITTLDNPAWNVVIDLEETDYEHITLDNLVLDNSEKDWYDIKIQDKKFIAYGDLTKLNFILKQFRQIIDS